MKAASAARCRFYMWAIYALDDFEGNTRYVGKTTVGLDERLYGHLWVAKHDGPNHVYNWIRSVEFSVSIRLLEECPENDHNYLNYAERYWITNLRELGFRLTNMNNGGQGGYGYRHTEASKEKMRISHTGLITGDKHHFYGKAVSESRKQNISKGLKGKLAGQNNPMYGVRRYGKDSPNYGKKHSEESKRKMSEAFKGKPSIASHTRWHVNRNIKKDGCEFCD